MPSTGSGHLRRGLPPGTDLIGLCAQAPQRYPFLLHSAAPAEGLARYDLLLLGAGEELRLGASGELSGPGSEAAEGDFLRALDAWYSAEGREQDDPAAPFRSGWFLYLSYDLAAQVEPTLDLPQDPTLPVACAVRVHGALIRDHRDGSVEAVVEAGREDLLEALEADLRELELEQGGGSVTLGSLREDEPQRYLDAVARTIRYIHDGDVFQANLSRVWQGTARGAPLDLYRQLCAANPAPFAAAVRLGERWVLSSSPERLIEIRDGRIQTRPIAGTRPRGSDEASDRALIEELIAHPKERAEHVMLIDLERNDLGRVSRVGSVEVDELMVIESYAHVHHIVSNVRGELRAEVGPGEAIRAVFPGGTITGCPKVRCMQIIQEMEGAPRAAYTGSLGYLDLDGSLDLNILIRTLEVAPGELPGELSWRLRAGAGIVADSVPERELEETRAKAKGLLRALDPSHG